MRQVEVLREVVLGLLAADTTLEPRDILVMCPDVETFAPLIAAAFSLGSPDDAHHPASRLRVRLADRALRQTNPLLEVLSQLLALGTARMTAPQVLDLAGRPAVRQRFGFADDDLEQLRDWVVDAGVRWGLDTDHRQGWKLGNLDQGTWRAGLDRLLLGIAMHGDVLGPGQTVPVDDVDSAGIDLAGRLAELVDRLSAAQLLMAGRHTAAEWMSGLQAAVESLATVRTRDAWQQLQLSGELADVAEAAAGSPALIGLADVRSLLGGVLAGRPTRASFRTGTLTVCTLVPMRSVPHRVVCVLGLDDGAFPRQSGRDGDDVLARDPWVGERDPRSEDRQLLLDAVFAAGDHLVIAYSGADERTGINIPPAVPLGEILDALDRTATVAEGGPVRDKITTRHPLQPFDARNFMTGELDTSGPFSFDPIALGGALAATRPRPQPPGFLSGPLPAQTPADIDLGSLQRLLEHPARGFLRQRLQVAPSRSEDEPDDAIPIDLDSLQRWQVGERALRERVGGVDARRWEDVELRRGAVPPGPLGDAVLDEIGATVQTLLDAASAELALLPEAHDVDIDLHDGTRLVGTVGDVRGDVLLSVTYSTLAPKHRLHAWVPLVCLATAHPGTPWRAVVVGKGKPATRSELGPVPPDEARAALQELVELYRAGLRAPLPLPVKTSGEYADRRARGGNVANSLVFASRPWLNSNFPGEQADAEHTIVYGEKAPLDVLTAERPWPGEGGAGWPADEPDRFGLLARRLWARLLAAETVRTA
jgi:exodeoxyribonuclease V gamma subunit